MVFNTLTVASNVTPTIIGTFIAHYLNRKQLAKKPSVHISYDEGLHLIRQFLIYASHHTVEEIQRFTAQWVPHPRWVKVDEVNIGEEYIKAAAEAIQAQLGHHGIERVGGKIWWQWRRPGNKLKAEWIEMRSDYNERRKLGKEVKGKRIMLYVHGGGYFFGSVDEHRYQMQRHARKLKARILARMLVTLRDQGLPLPAGAILISPWVDLTHSFPSVSGDNPMDYIPPYGFQHRPSLSWPPPNSDDMSAVAEGAMKKLAHNNPAAQSSERDAVQGFQINENPIPGTQNRNAATSSVTNGAVGPTSNTVPGSCRKFSIMIDGKLVEIIDQIQMYTTNQMISHPLVSPVLQPSLGGLPPLLVMTGGGEALRDEQIYVAHKAANPAKYPPGDAFLDENPLDHSREQIGRWKPTDVQLQVWDDLCHVAPTLSFTKPAKYMYRSIAQFGAWALARAQHTGIEIVDDDNVSIISKSDTESEFDAKEERQDSTSRGREMNSAKVGKAGDPLPPFRNHMIRQRVDRHGYVYPLEHASSLPGCSMAPNDIGIIKEGPIRKWMTAKHLWDTKYASTKRRVQKERVKEMMEGYETFGDGEVPPPSALAGRRRKSKKDQDEERRERSWGMSLWSLWGSKHDKEAIDREHDGDLEPEFTIVTEVSGANARPLNDTAKSSRVMADQRNANSRSRSRRTVTDEHQTDLPEEMDENAAVPIITIEEASDRTTISDGYLSPDFTPKRPTKDITSNDLAHDEVAPPTTYSYPPIIEISKTNRPHSNGIAFPFRLCRSGNSGSTTASIASTATLTSVLGIPPLESGCGREEGESDNNEGNETWNGRENLKEEGKEGSEENVKERKMAEKPTLESL